MNQLDGETLARLAELVDGMEGEYGHGPWEDLKAELRRLGVDVRLVSDPWVGDEQVPP